MSVEAEKQDLRRRMRSLRLIADQKHGPEAASALIPLFMAQLDTLGFRAGSIVAGYWPIATEIDVRPLLARLEERGAVCALPVIAAAGAPLQFRRWALIEDLEDGPNGTMQPNLAAPVVRPQIMLVPLLAFDAGGRRLGQGGGYYDRTLAALREEGPVTAIGVGYALQERAQLPSTATDQRLDWILTEHAMRRAAP
ncbi:MAG: 5-formyltetrahydrofolate cyclo-ligase [Defluviicoccus sp.]